MMVIWCENEVWEVSLIRRICLNSNITMVQKKKKMILLIDK